ncbi:MAG: 3-isopropylmalate dehydratase small subunit [Spirochaetaceae bacterium]|jgi:3-isopropylmalate/(R)-2-methylmalate dehydratase small subunit|nr:3-isopropylmalate dehydratase small subunit [Spirochaetaceae bacterium]
MKTFGGSVLFLDREDINTDEIIPAKYLTENSREALKPFILEGLKLPGFDPRRDTAGKGAVVARGNFGCGSSREHAPWVFEANGVNIVIAESFARIFRQNMYNRGMIAAELPHTVLDEIFRDFAGRETTLEADVNGGTLAFKTNGREKTVRFTLGDFERTLVESGGWVEYAASRY